VNYILNHLLEIAGDFLIDIVSIIIYNLFTKIKHMQNIDRQDIARVAISESVAERSEHLKKIMLFYSIPEEKQTQFSKDVFTECINFWKNINNDDFWSFLRKIFFVTLGLSFCSWILQITPNLPNVLNILLKVAIGLGTLVTCLIIYKHFTSLNKAWSKIEEFEKLRQKLF
jgi:uncharacterized membrane protein YjfL (UPF0719 family)